ncbi:MAG: CPBP family intramembrane glutamic endopeptidase [Bacteroidales bacterium]
MRTKEQKPHIIGRYKYAARFYLLATLIPWVLWFSAGYFSHKTPATPHSELLTGLLSFAGLCAPVAIAMIYMMQDKALWKDLRSRIFNFTSIKRHYIFLAFFLMPISILAAQAISLLFGYGVEQFAFSGSFTFTSSVFPVWFLLLVAPLLEELAWHSYGTDCLRARFNLFSTSLIFAIFWSFWHFPLTSIKGYYHSNLVESGLLYSINFVISLVPFVLIMNWLYYKTKRNLLLPIVFHITAGYFNEIFITHPMSKVIQTGLLLLLSLYLVNKERALFFQR